MAEDSGGLSDALRRMANAKLLASPPSEARRDPNPETGAGGGPERVLLAQLDEEPDPGPRPEGPMETRLSADPARPSSSAPAPAPEAEAETLSPLEKLKRRFS